MAVVDPALATVRLTGRELAAATLSVVDPQNPSLGHPAMTEAMQALEAGGARTSTPGAPHGGLVPALAGMVQVVHQPQLRVVVEVFRASAALAATIWSTPNLAVIARPAGGDALEYGVVDPVSLPFTLASLIGLGGGGTDGERRPVTVPADALDAAGLAVEGGDVPGALALLARRGMKPDAAAVVVAIQAERRASWRLCSAWMDEAGAVHQRTLTLVDAGAAGLWRADTDTDLGDDGPGAGTAVTLTPVAPSQVWLALVALLPVERSGPGAPSRTGSEPAASP